MSELGKSCGNCFHAQRVFSHQYARLECHRHAPLLPLQNWSQTHGAHGVWPGVSADDSCGDFERKPA